MFCVRALIMDEFNESLTIKSLAGFLKSTGLFVVRKIVAGRLVGWWWGEATADAGRENDVGAITWLGVPF